MIPVEELQAGDVVTLTGASARQVEVIRVDVYPAQPELAERGLETYAADAYVVVYRPGGNGSGPDGSSFVRTEASLAIRRAGDLIDAIRPPVYTQKARRAAAEQARSPRLADNSAAATATTPPMTDPEHVGKAGGARARQTDPSTSHAAARSIKAQELRESQELVFSIFDRFGAMDDVELVDRYRELALAGAIRVQSPSGIRTRRHELVDAGRLEDSGRQIRLESGRMATVWQVSTGPLALTLESEYDPEPEL